MDYTFDEEKFKRTFNVDESKDVNERRLTHVQEMGYKLYPNKAGTKATAVIDMRDVIGGFFRYALKIGKKQIKHDELCQEFYDRLDVKEEDKESIFEVISNLFFRNGYFYTENIGLYPYQTSDNKEADELSFFLYCVC